jgi:hypothetical protein
MSDQNREAFEAWANERGYPLDRLPHGHETLPLAYVFLATRDAWEGWQAATAHAQARACKWSPSEDFAFKFVTECGAETTDQEGDWCRYCGGKIEAIA